MEMMTDHSKSWADRYIFRRKDQCVTICCGSWILRKHYSVLYKQGFGLGNLSFGTFK